MIVNHFKLFTILYDKGLPMAFVDILVTWYTILQATVKWNDAFSEIFAFAIKSGVLQGIILSPLLFNSYIDCMLNGLERTKLGCHIFYQYVGCIMYADDILLLSASVMDLQKC